MNVAILFDRQAHAAPHAPAVRWDHGSMTYGALRDLALRFAAMARARGLRPGDRIALLLPNDAAFAVALLGTFWMGAVAVVCSPAWAPADAANALELADARLLITTEALAAGVGATTARTLTVDDAAGMGALGAALRRLAPRVGDEGPEARDGDECATILFSSGTTGEPKGVMLTHGNLVFNALSKIRYCGITPADRLAMVVPMSHCFGQNVVLLGALLAGAAVKIHARFDGDALRDDIATGEVTMLFAAPTAFARLLAAGDDGLRTLRYALSAAAPLGDDLARRWFEATKRPLSQGYGLTECSPFATYQHAAVRGGRVGRAIDRVELRIATIDGEGGPADGASGEIVLRGPNVMAGYWRRPDATASALRGGWLRTGDIGLLDEDGTLHLTDRVDDMINVAGFKAWPSDVERVLLRHPLVEEAAAYARPDAVRGSVVSAAVVLRHGAPGGAATLDDIERFAARTLASYQRPTRLRAVHALPRSAAGKVLRRMLATDAAATRGAPERG